MRLDGKLAGKMMLALLLALPCAAPAWADMYQCRDRNGSLRFTNVPSSESCHPVSMRQITVSAAFRSVDRYPFQPGQSVATEIDTFDGSLYWAANRYSLDPLLIKAIIHTESAFNARAVSSRGAQGLMQLMPDTARELFVRNPFNPHENIVGGSRYLRTLLDTFGENLVLSLAAYNAGPGAVVKAGGVPDFRETRQYVVKVLKKYRSLRQGEHG
jgi:soluble lytic murein transglycosylase-like protein